MTIRENYTDFYELYEQNHSETTTRQHKASKNVKMWPTQSKTTTQLCHFLQKILQKQMETSENDADVYELYE